MIGMRLSLQDLQYLDFKIFSERLYMHHYPVPITDRKIRFALVGCGRIAQNHFAAIKQHNDKS